MYYEFFMLELPFLLMEKENYPLKTFFTITKKDKLLLVLYIFAYP